MLVLKVKIAYPCFVINISRNFSENFHSIQSKDNIYKILTRGKQDTLLDHAGMGIMNRKGELWSCTRENLGLTACFKEVHIQISGFLYFFRHTFYLLVL